MANVYHANYNTSDPRPRRAVKQFVFGAASDSVADAITAELANWTTGQLTSLTKNVGGSGAAAPGGSYPAGTRVTANCIVSDAAGNVWHVRFRNVNVVSTANVEAAITALLLGNAYADSEYAVVALGAAPTLPNSGNPVAVVNAIQLVTKS